MKIEKRDVQMLPISEILPYERNPRDHSQNQIEELKNSIRQWGWTMPVLVDEEKMVIAGHGRLYAAQELGIDEVPCLMTTGWSDEQKQAYVIADNKIAENSTWNQELYISELRKLDDVGFDLTLAGLDPDFVDNFSFSPNLAPITNFADVTSDQIQKTSESLGEYENKQNSTVMAICPHCGEEFEFSGS
jgi:hypothetical protein